MRNLWNDFTWGQCHINTSFVSILWEGLGVTEFVPVSSTSHQRNAKSTPSRFHLEFQFNLFSFSCTFKICMKGKGVSVEAGDDQTEIPPPVLHCLLCLAITRAFPSRKRKEAVNPLWCSWQLRVGNEADLVLMGTPPVWIRPTSVSCTSSIPQPEFKICTGVFLSIPHRGVCVCVCVCVCGGDLTKNISYFA